MRLAALITALLWPLCTFTSGAEPLQVIVPAASPIIVHVPDVARLRQHFEHSPYATLAATSWGKQMYETMTSKLASVDDKYPAHQVLANIEQLTVGMDLHNGQELMVADVHFRDQQPFLKLLAGIGTPINPTTWTVFGAGLRAILLADRHWCLTLGAPDVAYRPRAQALPPISVTHDIGIRFDIKGLIGTLRAATEMPDAASLPQDMILTGGVDVGAFGTREAWTLAFGNDVPVAQFQANPTPADVQELLRLPSSTVYAATVAINSTMLNALGQNTGIDQAASSLIAQGWMTNAGFPKVSDLLKHIGNRLFVVIEESLPTPIITVSMTYNAAAAPRLLESLAKAAGLVSKPDGTASGFINAIVPLTLAYRDGSIVATTDANGIEACLARRAAMPATGAKRFGEIPAVAQAAARLTLTKPGIIALSDSSRLFRMVMASVAPMLRQIAGEGIVSAPMDMAALPIAGQLELANDARSATCHADGLIGGPFGFYTLWMSMGSYVVYRDRVVVAINERAAAITKQLLEQQALGKPVQPPAPAPVVKPAPQPPQPAPAP